MDVALIGLHKRFCDEAFFEKVYSHIQSLDFYAHDIVLLATCNRIEIYVASSNLSERHPELLEKIKQPFEENIEKRFYTFMGQDVLRHLTQVTSGLDSLICGESDIQHQVKKAYETQGKRLNKDGHFLFQKALHMAKVLRSKFDIKPVKSLEDQVCMHVGRRLDRTKELLFVGNSELNQKIFKKLSLLGSFKTTLVSAKLPNENSEFFGCKTVFYNKLDHLEEVCGVICATKDRRILSAIKIKEGGFICDISRPKIMPICTGDYLDLDFFEKLSSKQALVQYAQRLDALEYLNQNIKRLLDNRLLSCDHAAS